MLLVGEPRARSVVARLLGVCLRLSVLPEVVASPVAFVVVLLLLLTLAGLVGSTTKDSLLVPLGEDGLALVLEDETYIAAGDRESLPSVLLGLRANVRRGTGSVATSIAPSRGPRKIDGNVLVPGINRVVGEERCP